MTGEKKCSRKSDLEKIIEIQGGENCIGSKGKRFIIIPWCASINVNRVVFYNVAFY